MSNITSILILALGIYGVLLIMAKDTAIPSQLRVNSMIQTVYNNNTIAGGICIAMSYYFYTTLPKAPLQLDTTSEMTSATPDIPLPSYEQATSDAL
jgi:hypothetical protein